MDMRESDRRALRDLSRCESCNARLVDDGERESGKCLDCEMEGK